MRKLFLLFIVLIHCALVHAQSSIRVPSHMTFADVKLKITDKGRKAIQEEVDRIMQSPKYFEAKVEKANVFFPIIEAAFREEGVSPDFKYLSLQESALIADAVSKSNAVGYWQFKDFTAVEMGLRVDRHIDERMNIYASSRAAARYMKKNNTYFDNWIFALQAYQMGAGDAMKAIDKKHYGSKSVTITDDTYWYVKTFLAHMIAYGSAVGKEKSSPELVVYEAGGGKSLHDIANETNIELAELEEYNLWLRKGRVPTDKSYQVILPTTKLTKVEMAVNNDAPKPVLKKALDFDAKQSALYPKIDTEKRYSTSSRMRKINGILGIKAQPDEKVRDLVAKGEISISKFLKYNDITIDHKVQKGQVYYYKTKKSKARLYYHVVQEGETLWSISQKYGIKLSKLLTKNRMREVEDVKPGRLLWIRHIRPADIPIAYKKTDKPSRSNSVAPIVKESSLEEQEEEIILDKQEPTIENDSVLTTQNENVLEGTSSDLTVEISAAAAEEEEEYEQQYKYSVLHVVTAGQTLYRLSVMYDVEVMDIVRWNKLDLSATISAGQELMILTNRKESELVEELKESKKPKEETKEPKKHVVKTGETLYKISREYEVSIDSLIQWNNKSTHDVNVGEELLIWSEKKGE